jgi:ABC-type Fe3+-hydroxamate transport system substrate-binding protein
MHPSLEPIIALKPQVVLISTASQLEVFTQQLQNQNIAAFVTDPHDLEGVFRSIEQVGEILGKKAQAATLVQTLRQRTYAVEQAVKQKQPVRLFHYRFDATRRRNVSHSRRSRRLAQVQQ